MISIPGGKMPALVFGLNPGKPGLIFRLMVVETDLSGWGVADPTPNGLTGTPTSPVTGKVGTEKPLDSGLHLSTMNAVSYPSPILLGAV